jgi:serine/threonine-protein kinase RsbW
MADLPRIGEFVEDSCVQIGIDPAARFDVLMAVDEACSNIFEHAYGGLTGEVNLCCETRGKDLIITVRDHGRAFNPAHVPTPDMNLPLKDRPIGGLGLHLMRQLMDRVCFDFSPQDGNTLVMEKHAVARRRGSSTKSSRDVVKRRATRRKE